MRVVQDFASNFTCMVYINSTRPYFRSPRLSLLWHPHLHLLLRLLLGPACMGFLSASEKLTKDNHLLLWKLKRKFLPAIFRGCTALEVFWMDLKRFHYHQSSLNLKRLTKPRRRQRTLDYSKWVAQDQLVLAYLLN